MNLKVLVKRAIYQPTITLMFIAYWRHHKIWKFLYWLKLISSVYLRKHCEKNFHLETYNTLLLVVWWLHQSKNISFCFNTNSFCCLINAWWLELSKESSVNLRKLIFSLDLINYWWLKLRVSEPIVTLALDTR